MRYDLIVSRLSSLPKPSRNSTFVQLNRNTISMKSIDRIRFSCQPKILGYFRSIITRISWRRRWTIREAPETGRLKNAVDVSRPVERTGRKVCLVSANIRRSSPVCPSFVVDVVDSPWHREETRET